MQAKIYTAYKVNDRDVLMMLVSGFKFYNKLKQKQKRLWNVSQWGCKKETVNDTFCTLWWLTAEFITSTKSLDTMGDHYQLNGDFSESSMQGLVTHLGSFYTCVLLELTLHV